MITIIGYRKMDHVLYIYLNWHCGNSYSETYYCCTQMTYVIFCSHEVIVLGICSDSREPLETSTLWTAMHDRLECVLASLPIHLNNSISQIPLCIRQISHNAPLCNRNVHVCTFLLQKGALWDMGPVHHGICEIGLFIAKYHTAVKHYYHIIWCIVTHLSIPFWYILLLPV